MADRPLVGTENFDETARCRSKVVWFLLQLRAEEHDIKYAELIQRLDLARGKMMARTTSGLLTVHDNPASFTCSQCGAQYKVVRVKMEIQSLDHLLYCKVCKQPLAATDGEDILKYFLMGRPPRKSKAAPRL